MLIDAKNKIVGRLGAVVAKKALLGERIDIINAEQAVISGSRQKVLARFRQKLDRGTWSKGPHYVRTPERLLKRMIRDMLPYKRPRGRAALNGIRCWIGVPDQFKGKNAEDFKEADASKLIINSVSVKEISRLLGGNVD